MNRTVTAELRTETDMLGSRDLPAVPLYGIHTLRAVENFPFSGMTVGGRPDLVGAPAMVKPAAARANHDCGVLEAPQLAAIEAACAALLGRAHHDAFVVDMIQEDAGTSTNMNANEVIANLGLDHLGQARGDYVHLHPNDHVNRSQSANDVYPTAMRIALILAAQPVAAGIARLSAAPDDRGTTFAAVLKIGRTQLQDAVPMTLGAEFAAFAAGTAQEGRHLEAALEGLLEINLGGTAIGTGINAPEGYRAAALVTEAGLLSEAAFAALERSACTLSDPAVA